MEREANLECLLAGCWLMQLALDSLSNIYKEYVLLSICLCCMSKEST